jgi:ADP-heptose:LPS heptosyltransferase
LPSGYLHTSRARFTRFKSKVPFEFGLPNVNAKLTQKSDNSSSYLTRVSSLLRQQVLKRAPEVKIVSDEIRLDVLKKDRWTQSFDHKRVLFVIPSDALGDCVGMTMFFRAFKHTYPNAKIAVFNTGSASDIFSLINEVEIFQLFISMKQMRRFDYIIDLSEMEGWKDIATTPVDPEQILLGEFGIDPLPLQPVRQPIKSRLRIGVLPMASSPLRTLPPEFVRRTITHLNDLGHDVSVILNSYQGVKEKYKKAIGILPTGVTLSDGFKTIAKLLGYIDSLDYVVLADSGPAHMTKLFAIPGIGVYTSASASVLQGRYDNLKAWQSSFEGPYCKAPCGLAKMRATADGRIGCMGSLGVPIEELNELPKFRKAGLASELVTNKPVPCVADLIEEFDLFEAFLEGDLQKLMER